MPETDALTKEAVAVTAEELDQVYDVLQRLTLIVSGVETDWYVLMAARGIVSRKSNVAKYGSVPGE